MKTAISTPDDLFEDAERLAGKLQTSRSKLYARALSEFVARHNDDQEMTNNKEPVQLGRRAFLRNRVCCVKPNGKHCKRIFYMVRQSQFLVMKELLCVR